MKRLVATIENLKKVKKGDILRYSWGTEYEIIKIIDSDKNGIRVQLKCVLATDIENIGDIISIYINFRSSGITRILSNNFNEKLNKLLSI